MENKIMRLNFVENRTVTKEGGINIYTKEDINGMRKACKLAAQVLNYIEPYIKPCISTKELDTLCHDFIISNKGKPACLGYNNYPASICTSINQVVCHGIPSINKILKNGDIINIDLVVELDGWHGDNSRTFPVGTISPIASKLIDVTQRAMMIGIKHAQPGAYTSSIGRAIDEFVTPLGYGIVRDYCGHGIGRKMHESPDIIHFKNNLLGPMLVPGMCLTVEPMINIGSSRVKLLKDNWTVVTKDKKLSAQFEHTIVITPDGNEILTIDSVK